MSLHQPIRGESRLRFSDHKEDNLLQWTLTAYTHNSEFVMSKLN